MQPSCGNRCTLPYVPVEHKKALKVLNEWHPEQVVIYLSR